MHSNQDAATVRRRRRAFIIAIATAAAVLVPALWPRVFGLHQGLIVAQALAFREAIAIAAGVGCGLLLILALVTRRRVVAPAVALACATACAIGAIGNVAVLANRGMHTTEATDGDLVVVTWNTLGGAVAPEAIADLVLATGADFVSLPETDRSAVEAVASIVSAAGRPMTSATTGSRLPTSVLLSEELGEYRIDTTTGSTPNMPSGVWRPVDGDGPTLIAAHTMPPLPTRMDEWRADLAWISERCDGTDVVIAGDLNATVDHLDDDDGCHDAAHAVGAAAIGTWPTSAPTWLATPIDHVLVSSGWEVLAFDVLTAYDSAGSDHRPIVAVLARR